jgi:hypothetical protein
MPLPFDLPGLSRGYAALTPAARALGSECAASVARSLSAVIGRELRVEGRAVPAAPAPRAAAARLAIELGALPGRAVLEVEAALVVRLVDVLAGGTGGGATAAALTPVEAGALDLLALAAIDGACAVGPIEERLAPRLSAGADADVPGALAIELRLEAGELSGRARLLLPAAAVSSLAGSGPPGESGGPARLPASLRSGSATLSPDELAALAPGDVVVIEPADGGLEDLVLPGGARLRGRRDGDAFTVEEVLVSQSPAQLPIVLEVEFARLEISAAELARLAPGAVWTLPVDRRGLVTLRAGERAVARGELVDVEGAVGVRVLSVEGAP